MTVSLAAAVPGIGQATTAGKFALKGADAVKSANVAKATKRIRTKLPKGLKTAQKEASRKALKGDWAKVCRNKAKLLKQKKQILKEATDKKVTLKDRYKGAMEAGNPKGAKIGGGNTLMKALNIIAPTDRLNFGLKDPVSPNTDKKLPETPKDDKETTPPIDIGGEDQKDTATVKPPDLTTGPLKAVGSIVDTVGKGIIAGNEAVQKTRSDRSTKS